MFEIVLNKEINVVLISSQSEGNGGDGCSSCESGGSSIAILLGFPATLGRWNGPGISRLCRSSNWVVQEVNNVRKVFWIIKGTDLGVLSSFLWHTEVCIHSTDIDGRQVADKEGSNTSSDWSRLVYPMERQHLFFLSASVVAAAKIGVELAS